jgi:hypothetical protein
MYITGAELCKKLGKAMLKGYFLGVEEERKRWLNRRERGILLKKSASICPIVKRF